MNRLVIVASVSVAIFLFAVFSGWSHYKAQPEGDLFYTPITHCPAMTHSFSTGFLLVLTVSGLVVLAIAGASMLATLIPGWSKKKVRLKYVTRTSISIILVLFAFSFLSPVFEDRLPLRIKPECLQNSP